MIKLADTARMIRARLPFVRQIIQPHYCAGRCVLAEERQISVLRLVVSKGGHGDWVIGGHIMILGDAAER